MASVERKLLNAIWLVTEFRYEVEKNYVMIFHSQLIFAKMKKFFNAVVLDKFF